MSHNVFMTEDVNTFSTLMYQYGHGSSGRGPWRVIGGDDLRSEGIKFDATPRHWYITNTLTGVSKRIGPSTGRGTNYFDRARLLAEQRNQDHWSKNPPTLNTPDEIADLWIERDRIVLEFNGSDKVGIRVRGFNAVINAYFEKLPGRGWVEIGGPFQGFNRVLGPGFNWSSEGLQVQIRGGQWKHNKIQPGEIKRLEGLIAGWLESQHLRDLEVKVTRTRGGERLY